MAVQKAAGAGILPSLPQRSAGWVALFRLYLRFLFWQEFDAIRLSRAFIPPAYPGQALILYCNHPSWWDPALLLLAVTKLFPGRRGYGPMDAAQLERYGLLRRMGIFGVEPGSLRGAKQFLRVSGAVSRHHDTFLCVTAEGAFVDPRLRPITLRPGLAHLARLRPDAIFLPLALEYSFWNESKPEALLRFGEPVRAPTENSVRAWQASLEAALTETMDGLAAESSARNHTAFVEMFRGTAGVGGIYDVWRRLRAALAGRRFRARHQPGPGE